MAGADVSHERRPDVIAEQLLDTRRHPSHLRGRHAEKIILLRPRPRFAVLIRECQPRRATAVRAAAMQQGAEEHHTGTGPHRRRSQSRFEIAAYRRIAVMAVTSGAP